MLTNSLLDRIEYFTVQAHVLGGYLQGMQAVDRLLDRIEHFTGRAHVFGDYPRK